MTSANSRSSLPWLLGIAFLIVAVFLASRGCSLSDSADARRPSSAAAPRAKATERPAERTSDEEVAQKLLMAGKEPVAWRDPSTGTDLKVRRTLKMTPVVRVEEGKESATGEVTLYFKEGADFWDNERSAWLPMREKQLARFRQGGRSSRIEYSADASIVKTAGVGAGPATIDSHIAFGMRKGEPMCDWSKAENGMSVFLDWVGNELTVSWACSSVAEGRVETVVVVPFSERFR